MSLHYQIMLKNCMCSDAAVSVGLHTTEYNGRPALKHSSFADTWISAYHADIALDVSIFFIEVLPSVCEERAARDPVRN